MDILTPSIPSRYRITQAMIEDFVADPIPVAEYVFNIKMDAFQRARMKLCHWTPRVMDCSGFSSVKTLGMWWYSNLRPILFEGYVSGVYYPTFEQGKRIYWQYFVPHARASDFYRMHCGRDVVVGIDGKTVNDAKAMDKGPSCSVFSYKNGSKVMMPAPDFLRGARSSAGFRFTDLYADEWTKASAIPGKGDAFDDQLVGRPTLKTYNDNHPVYCNHHLFLATAEDASHPAYERYERYLQEVRRGNPEYYVFNFSAKDYSNLPYRDGKTFREEFRKERALADIRKKGRAHFLQEGLGFWSKSGKGWYSGELIANCYALGRQMNAQIYCSRSEDPERERAKYFLGIDPARAETKKADDGALVVLRALPLVSESATETRAYQLSFCYAYKVRNADAAQWSAIIHQKHRHFGFSGLMMDSGGGGLWVQPELKKEVQALRGIETRVQPIGTLEDEGEMMVMGDFILCMFRPRDKRIEQTYSHIVNMRQENLTDIGHVEFRDGLMQGIGLPQPLNEQPPELVRELPDEKRWATVLVSDRKQGIGAQLMGIFVAYDEKGVIALTKGSNARKFSSRGRKDFAYAAMMAYMRFKIWLGSGADDLTLSDDDAVMCGGDRT